MLKLKQIKLKKIKYFLKKLPKNLGKRAFLLCLILLLISLITGLLIFYKYSFLTEKETPEISKGPLQFKEATFQRILEVWQEKDKKFEAADTKEYPDPFRVSR